MHIRRLIYFIIVILAAFTMRAWLPFPQTYWLVWSAFGLSLITFGNTFLQRVTCILLTGIALAAAVSLSGLTAVFTPLLYAFLCVATFLLIDEMSKRPLYLLPLFLLNLFVLLGILFAGAWSININPAVLVLWGAIIALVPQLIFWPHFVSRQIKQAIVLTIQELQGLTNEVFYCLLQSDYKDKLYLYEKRIHAQKNKLLAARQRLGFLITNNKRLHKNKETLLGIAAQIDFLYESFVSCAQVRWRTSDHTIFAVCEQDLAGLLQEINRAYNEFIRILTMQNKLHADLSPLSVRVNQLEQTYQNVMQVTAREPVVLLLFVVNLQYFINELITFNGQLTEIRAIFK